MLQGHPSPEPTHPGLRVGGVSLLKGHRACEWWDMIHRAFTIERQGDPSCTLYMVAESRQGPCWLQAQP